MMEALKSTKEKKIESRTLTDQSTALMVDLDYVFVLYGSIVRTVAMVFYF